MLSQLNQTWSLYLASDACPPILGLAPITDEEISSLTIGLRGQGGEHLDTLAKRLSDYPAAGALWLAAMSARAYKDGNFWDNFALETGYACPGGPHRERLRNIFRRTCRQIMSRFTPPLLDSHFHFVEFLYHAGLPLCHVPAFADAVRRVERREGLPDASDPTAGEWLRDRVLGQVPPGLVTLYKSVAGAAGPPVCEAALLFLLNEGQASVSQALQRELERVFGSAEKGKRELRRSPRPPFVRLGDDGASLEVCGPAQDQALLHSSGVRWLVAGKVQRVASGEEMRCDLAVGGVTEVLLSGLASGTLPGWRFDLSWPVADAGFWLFDAMSHRQRSVMCQDGIVEVQGGDYWLTHSNDYAVAGSEDEALAWDDGVRTTTRIRVRPQSEVVLTNAMSGVVVTLQAKASPVLEWEGLGIVTVEGDRLIRGSAAKLTVWLPKAGVQDMGWALRVECEGERWELALTQFSEPIGAFVQAVVPDVKARLDGLAAGLWQIRASVVKRGRAEAAAEAFVWQGLGTRTLAGDWALEAPPTNLVMAECRGFQVAAQELRHLSDGSRLHRLVFMIEGATRTFSWAQDGVFVASFERRPDEPSWMTSRRLGDAFVADTVSMKWLRVWRQPLGAWRITLGDQLVVEVPAVSRRAYVDISLANLATRFPTGGQLVWQDDYRQEVVARFSRPLSASLLAMAGDAADRSMTVKLAEMPAESRATVRDLVTGTALAWPNQAEPWLAADGQPRGTLALEAHDEGARLHIELCREGWPPGVWIAEVELRRDASSDWEPMRSPSGKHLPVMIAQPPTDAPASYREKAFWKFFGQGLVVPGPLEGLTAQPEELAAMLAEVGKLLGHPYHQRLQDYVRVLEALHQWLLTQAEWLLEQRDEVALALGEALLEADTAEDETDDGCSLLGRVPHLLALPGKAYAGLLPSTALRQALLWIGRAGALGSTAHFIREVMEPWMVGVSQRLPEVLDMAKRFANCGRVLDKDVTANLDFTGFNLTDYFEMSVGPWANAPHDGDELDAIDVLGKRHAHRALASARDRLERRTQLAALNRAQPLIRDTGFVRSELRQAMAGGFAFLPGNTNTPPWLRCDDDGAPMLAYLNAFTAMLALALRAAAAGRLSYRALVTTIIQKHSPSIYRNAVKLVHEVAPELLGYYLLLWELLLRTAPPPATANA